MIETSDLYKEIASGDYWVETRVAIGETGRLLDNFGNGILFGGVGILVDAGGAEGGYPEETLFSVETNNLVFSGNTPEVGGCVSGQLTLKMFKPLGEIVKQARIVPYVRITDGERYSEWIKKGVYYVDQRSESSLAGRTIINLSCYDAMMKAEEDYPDSTLEWPAKDIDVVWEIARSIGVGVDSRTDELMTMGYIVQYPGEYSKRETLGYIAAMYAGCFVMSDEGDLQLITLYSIPTETRYLVTGQGEAITFGGDRILV